eukprot:gene26998-12803_t
MLPPSYFIGSPPLLSGLRYLAETAGVEHNIGAVTEVTKGTEGAQALGTELASQAQHRDIAKAKKDDEEEDDDEKEDEEKEEDDDDDEKSEKEEDPDASEIVPDDDALAKMPFSELRKLVKDFKDEDGDVMSFSANDDNDGFPDIEKQFQVPPPDIKNVLTGLFYLAEMKTDIQNNLTPVMLVPPGTEGAQKRGTAKAAKDPRCRHRAGPRRDPITPRAAAPDTAGGT